MANYLLYWDSVQAGFILTLEVAPDDGIEVRGVATFVVPGNPDVTKTLGYDDLVPKWSHVFKANESVHMTLSFVYHTTAVSSVRVSAECRTAAGAVHQTSYVEEYDGQRPGQKQALVSGEAL